MVNEKKTNFQDDYIILNPPLGQGNILFLKLIKGTYGEVRQVKHRQSMQLRAVKIIKKDFTSEEAKTQL